MHVYLWLVLKDAIEFKEELPLVPTSWYKFVTLVKRCLDRFKWNIEFLGITQVTSFGKIGIRFRLGQNFPGDREVFLLIF